MPKETLVNCDFCGCLYGKFLDHLCPSDGTVKQLGDPAKLEQLIIDKDLAALALLGKDTGYVEE